MFRSSTVALLLVPVVCFTVVKSSIGSISIVPSVPSMRRWRRGWVPFEQTETVQVVRGHSMTVSVCEGVPSGSPGAALTIVNVRSGITSCMSGRVYSITWHVSR